MKRRERKLPLSIAVGYLLYGFCWFFFAFFRPIERYFWGIPGWFFIPVVVGFFSLLVLSVVVGLFMRGKE